MKHPTISILLIFAIALTACSAFSTSAGTNSTQASDELPAGTQLAAGILKLEATENEVTPEQASELLVLWQVYRELSQSDTAAQEEVDALVDQIQENMTTQQMQAITAMQLSQQDVFTAMRSSNVVSTSSSQSNSSSNNAAASGGGMPAGGPPDMGGGMPADFEGIGGSVTSNGQTQNAQTSSGLESSAGVPSALVEAVIQVLEQKVAS
jgi:hypothetical protein